VFATHNTDSVHNMLAGEFALTLLLSASRQVKKTLSRYDLLAIRSALMLELPQEMLQEAVRLHEAATRKTTRTRQIECERIQSRSIICFLACRPEVLSLPSMCYDAIAGYGVFEVSNGSGTSASDIARLVFLRNVDPNIHLRPRFPSEKSRPFAEAFVEFYINIYGGGVGTHRVSRKRETDLQCLFSRSSERLDMNTAWRVVSASVKSMLWQEIETPRRVLFLLLQADHRLQRQDDYDHEDDTVRQSTADVVRRALIEASQKLVTEPAPQKASGLLRDIELLFRLTVSRAATAETAHVFAARGQALFREIDQRGQSLHRLSLNAQP